MAEAFIVRRGGGGGSGGTLAVTSSGAGTVTVSNSALGKSYSKSVTAGGSVTFKGLKTGEWTVTLSNGAQTVTRSVAINADYSVSVAYFSATISVTYPANSNCVVTNSGGQTVASDTNTGSSTKTWTATVGATGTYTVTATATDGSGKTKSTTVSITADGQSSSVTLSYELVLFDNGTVSGYTWTGLNNNGTTLSLRVENSSGYGDSASGSSVQTIDMRDYTTLKFHVVSSNTTGPYSGGVTLGTNGATVNFKNESNVVKAVNISSVNSGQIYFGVSANSSAAGGTQYCEVVVDKIWLE